MDIKIITKKKDMNNNILEKNNNKVLLRIVAQKEIINWCTWVILHINKLQIPKEFKKNYKNSEILKLTEVLLIFKKVMTFYYLNSEG